VVAKFDLGNFSESRMGLFGSHGFDSDNYPFLLGIVGRNLTILDTVKVVAQGSYFKFLSWFFTTFSD